MSGRRPGRPAATIVLFAVAVAVLALDIVSKVLVVAFMTPGRPFPVVGNAVSFTLIRNPGAAFSMATGMTWVLSVVALLVVVGIVRYGRRLTSPWWAAGLGLVLGGALGNLVDRIFRAPGPLQGYVVDFVSVGSFPVFNLADSGITVGAVLLAALALFGVEPQRRHGSSAADDAERATAHEGAADPVDPAEPGGPAGGGGPAEGGAEPGGTGRWAARPGRGGRTGEDAADDADEEDD